MDTCFEKLLLISYNSRGFNDSKQEFICQLLSKCNFLLLQEHWLFESQLSNSSLFGSNSLLHGVSGLMAKRFLAVAHMVEWRLFGIKILMQ